jgi:hypothetical protein
MGESKDLKIREEIARDKEKYPTPESQMENLGFLLEDEDVEYPAVCDPDHLNPSKGGNKASDDYW